MKNLVILTFITFCTVSCIKFKDPVDYDLPGTFLSGSGAFIINEGNFNWGNGSVSYFSYDSAKIYNDIFESKNQRPLGDVPNSMMINGDKIYIVVNNSGKIEVVSKLTFESVKTITGLISPRNMAVINNNKAYVTSLYSDSLAILDLSGNSISGYINIHRTSESIVTEGSKAFVSNWVGGREVMVIDTNFDEVVDSIEVSVEPETMVVDKNQKLWVLCTGGWMQTSPAELIKIDISNNEVMKRYTFPSGSGSPSCLQSDGDGDTLYFIWNGINRMDINATELPQFSFIPPSDRFFYKIGINPVNGDVLATDAVDYQERGFILLYDKNGNLKSFYQAGIIPASVCYKVKANPDTY